MSLIVSRSLAVNEPDLFMSALYACRSSCQVMQHLRLGARLIAGVGVVDQRHRLQKGPAPDELPRQRHARARGVHVIFLDRTQPVVDVPRVQCTKS